MSTPNPYVVEVMRSEIKAVKRQVWSDMPDRVCSPTTERKTKTEHDRLSFEQAQLCQQTYLETAKARLKRYLETGEILAVSVPTRLAF